IAVTVNGGAPQFFGRAAVDVLIIDTDSGQDAITITGTDEDEVAHFIPGQASLRVGTSFAGANYGILALDVETAEVTAGTGGTDLAVMRDTRTISDALVASANTATLTAGAGRLVRSIDFDQVRALTTIVTGGAEDDTADRNAINYVLELAGSWREI
ncbi:MAG TPA: hypothetical protein VFV87_05335, partial [Pirellulaceae bacterium]|nr:hypothetical protein [Pirellulaceae bacterium]